MQTPPISANEDPNRALENALVEDYLRARGYTLETVHELPPKEATRVMTDAARAADQRLAEIECRAHWVSGVHHGY